MARGYLIGESYRDRIDRTISAVGAAVEGAAGTKIPVRLESIARPAAGGSTIRLGQTSGQWPNEPPLNVKAVQLFRQQTEEELGRTPQPWEWVPETDEYGDPVFAVTINWFSHVPVGQGDLIKWCAVVPISSLAGEYDTGQVIPDPDGGPATPIMQPYSKLWLLIAVEC